MTNSKSTRRALVSSILSIILCVAMLVGMTFAWFTDTASTGVNIIQAGNLKIDIVDKNGNSLDGKMLSFRDVNGNANILWEPGATFNLDSFKIVNKGNLALKYKVVINGIDGDAKLLEAIDFHITKVTGTAITEKALENFEGKLLPKDAAAAAADEEVGETALYTISGKMRTSAGNEYQGLSLDSIGIAVYATQYSYENDSNGNTYDSSADMTPDNLDKLMNVRTTVDVAKNDAGEITETILADTARGAEADFANPNFTYAAKVPAAAIAEDADKLQISITPKTSAPAGISIASDQGVMPYEIKITGLKENNDTPVTVKFYIGKGLENVQVYHNTSALTSGAEGENGFTYDAGTGYLTISPKSFSPFTVVYKDPVAMVDGTACYDLTGAVNKASEGSMITLCKTTTEPLKLANEGPITIKGVTFKSSSGVTIKGLQLSATSKTNKVTLENVAFEGIHFTDKVILGQSASTNGYSRCSDISFENCTFDMSASAERYKDAIYRQAVTVSGTIADKEADAYLNGLIVKNCEFKNTRNGIKAGKIRNLTIEDCSFTSSSSAAVNLSDAAGKILLSDSRADNTAGILEINTVGNNYSTTKIDTEVIIKNNQATNMTCDNGYVFYTTYDNAKASGKSTYTITGNSCTYAKTFDAPLNGFRIKNTYGPSKAEFIENK